MNSSQNILLEIYKDKRNVFTVSDVAQLTGINNRTSLSWRLNYYVRQGQLLNPRRGVYTKQNYRIEELAACLYVPSYISFEYVLQRKGVVFQYDTKITMASYLSRTINIGDSEISYRKIKGEILVNMSGVDFIDGVFVASAERAFLDLFYLNPDFYFDNLSTLNKKKINELLPIYLSKALEKRVKNLLKND